MKRGPPLRFRCQVGHGYTAEVLATRQEDSVDEAMRVALRIVEERATLTKKMADETRRGGLRLSADSYESTSRQSRRHVETLREALRSGERAEALPQGDEAEGPILAPSL